MNEIEIIEKQNDITYEVAQVSFPAYEEYKEKAQLIADYIDTMDVDEDSVKEVNQTLAKARKLTGRLSKIRIDMKRDLLKNYNTFESQVKEICGIVDRADSDLRAKVRELDELERKKKVCAIHDVWDKRVSQYSELETILPDAFERWLSPKHLNKTVTMKSIEKDMTEWIRKTYEEMEAAKSMGHDYLVAFAWKGTLADAVAEVNSHREREEAVKKANLEEGGSEEKEVFAVFGKKDIALTEMLLNDHNIKYIIY